MDLTIYYCRKYSYRKTFLFAFNLFLLFSTLPYIKQVFEYSLFYEGYLELDREPNVFIVTLKNIATGKFGPLVLSRYS